MVRRSRSLWLLVAAGVLLHGCTLQEMKKDTGEREERIKYKESELLDLKSQEADLQAQKQQLVSDLQNERSDLDRLSVQLKELQRRNDAIKSENAARRREQQELSKRLKSYQQDVAALKKRTDLPDAKKKKRIQELNEEIKIYLKRGL